MQTNFSTHKHTTRELSCGGSTSGPWIINAFPAEKPSFVRFVLPDCMPHARPPVPISQIIPLGCLASTLVTPRIYSLFVNVHHLHVHRVNRSEDVGRTLDDALARFRHGDRGAGRYEDGLVTAAQRQIGQIVALHQYHLWGEGRQVRRLAKCHIEQEQSERAILTSSGWEWFRSAKRAW